MEKSNYLQLIRYTFFSVVLVVLSYYLLRYINEIRRNNRLVPIADLDVVDYNLSELDRNFDLLDKNTLKVEYSPDLVFNYKQEAEILSITKNTGLTELESVIGSTFEPSQTSTDPYYGTVIGYVDGKGYLSVYQEDKKFIYSQFIENQLFIDNFTFEDDLAKYEKQATDYLTKFVPDNYDVVLDRTINIVYPDPHVQQSDTLVGAGAILYLFDISAINGIPMYQLGKTFKEDQKFEVMIRRNGEVIRFAGPLLPELLASNQYVTLKNLEQIKSEFETKEYLLTGSNDLDIESTLQKIIVNKIQLKYAINGDILTPIYVAEVDLTNLKGETTSTQVVLNAIVR